jgi:hypothetical protein
MNAVSLRDILIPKASGVGTEIPPINRDAVVISVVCLHWLIILHRDLEPRDADATAVDRQKLGDELRRARAFVDGRLPDLVARALARLKKTGTIRPSARIMVVCGLDD